MLVLFAEFDRIKEANHKRMSTLLDRVRSLLQCPICHEGFKVPKTLPCMHNFCADCLNKHIVHTGPNFRCPFRCNVGSNKLFITSCQNAGSLTTNFFIESLSDICKAVEGLEKELTETPKSPKELEDELAKTRQSIKELEEELAKTRHSVKELEQELAKTRQSVKELEKKLTETRHSVNEFKEELTEEELAITRQSIGTLKEELAKMRQFIIELDEQSGKTTSPHTSTHSRQKNKKAKTRTPRRLTTQSTHIYSNDVYQDNSGRSPTTCRGNQSSLNETWKVQESTEKY